MPKYNFTCKSCNSTIHKYVNVSVEEIDCSVCGAKMQRNMPKIDSQTEVREVIDAYTNTTWIKDQKEIMKDRRNKYFKEVEIPRLIEKYSIETCLENKWLIYNDKGELVINKDWSPENT